MPLAVTIFGVGESASPPVFCYAFFRLIRGAGEYPAPGLPENRTNDPQRTPIDGTNLELVAWDSTFDETAASGIQSELDQGQFTIPVASPIEPGELISGAPFGPIALAEHSNELRVSGAGVLNLKGIAV